MWKLWIYPVIAFILAYSYRFLPCKGSLFVTGCAIDQLSVLLGFFVTLPIYFVFSAMYTKRMYAEKHTPKLFIFILLGIVAYLFFPGFLWSLLLVLNFLEYIGNSLYIIRNSL
jgi:hypothetical protein